MKIALFLGAGASVPYGMPTTRELREKIRHDDLDFPRKDLLDPDGFPDIEHVLSVLDQLLSFLQSRAGGLYTEFTTNPPDKKEHAPSALEFSIERLVSYVNASHKSKEIIEDIITQNYKWSTSKNASAEKILGPLFDFVKSKDEQVTVFTTNYDTAIEEYCGKVRRNTECVDGFKFDDVRRRVVWDGKFVPQNDALGTKVFLYKLHGSMNWLADDSDDRMAIVQKPNTDASSDPEHDMYIRPSLDTKDEATQKEPYATILRQFSHILPSFDVCIVIGYSFRDPHISKELVEFIKSGKTLILLSPTATTDFDNNVLKRESLFNKKDKWRRRGRLHGMILESEGANGIACALNESLSKDSVISIVDAMALLIKAST